MKCSFCGHELPNGRGKMYVRISGQLIYFCSSKCNRNYKLKRDGKRVKWTDRFKDIKEKETAKKSPAKKD